MRLLTALALLAACGTGRDGQIGVAADDPIPRGGPTELQVPEDAHGDLLVAGGLVFWLGRSRSNVVEGNTQQIRSEPFDEVRQLDTETNTWSRIPRPSTATDGRTASADVIDGRLVVVTEACDGEPVIDEEFSCSSAELAALSEDGKSWQRLSLADLVPDSGSTLFTVRSAGSSAVLSIGQAARDEQLFTISEVRDLTQSRITAIEAPFAAPSGSVLLAASCPNRLGRLVWTPLWSLEGVTMTQSEMSYWNSPNVRKADGEPPLDTPATRELASKGLTPGSGGPFVPTGTLLALFDPNSAGWTTRTSTTFFVSQPMGCTRDGAIGLGQSSDQATVGVMTASGDFELFANAALSSDEQAAASAQPGTLDLVTGESDGSLHIYRVDSGSSPTGCDTGYTAKVVRSLPISERTAIIRPVPEDALRPEQVAVISCL